MAHSNTIPSDLGTRKDQLIEAIYRIALDPQSYDTFMEHWDDYVADRLGDADASAELDRHFAIASRLLEETMPPPTADGRVAMASGDNRSAPRFLIDGRARVVWYNAAAERMFRMTTNDMCGKLIENIMVPPRLRQSHRRRLKRLVEAGVIEKHAYSDKPPRFEYKLTPKGKDLGPALAALKDWGKMYMPVRRQVQSEN